MNQKDLARLDQDYKGRLREHGCRNLIFVENQEKPSNCPKPGKSWWDFIRTGNFPTRSVFCELELQSIPGARRPNVFQWSIWYFLWKPHQTWNKLIFSELIESPVWLLQLGILKSWHFTNPSQLKMCAICFVPTTPYFFTNQTMDDL